MAIDTYEANNKLLESKGLKLKPTKYMFYPYGADNGKYKVIMSEFGGITITNKITGKHTHVDIHTELIEEDDFK